MNTFTTRTLVVLLSLLILATVGSQIYFRVNDRHKTEEAVLCSINENIPFKGIIVRNERVVSYSGGGVFAPSSLNPDVIVEREEIRKIIIQAINELPEKEKMVIVLYYHEDLTFKEIGQVLEVSESRISQLHTKANLRLRAKLTNLRKGIM